MVGSKVKHIDDYNLVGEIKPHGGFAQLYKAKHTEEMGFVAIKRLDNNPSNNDFDFANLLKKEKGILTNLAKGPHIIRVIDYVDKDDAEDEKAYLVLEYIDGKNLRHIHSSGEKVPLEDVVQYVEQIAQAIDYAHNRGIYHCDIRPENILKKNTPDGKVELVLCDFGLAVKDNQKPPLITFSDGRESLNLNKDYWSPEQFKNTVTAQSDQFAVGVMVYEWLCGKRPFKDGDNEREKFDPLCIVNNNIPKEVSDIVSKALDNKSTNRYKDMREFANALSEAAKNVPGSVKGKEEESSPKPPISQTQTSAPQLPPHNASLQPPITRRQVIWAGFASIPAAILLPLTWARLLPELEKRLFPPSPDIGTIIQVYRGHRGNINSVAWSPDGTRIVSTSSDGTAQVWDATTGDSQALFGKYTEPSINGVSWLGNHAIASCSGNLVYVWSADDGSQLYPPYTGHNATVQAVAWAPQPVPWLRNMPQSLASFGNDGFVQLIHYENGQWVQDFPMGPFFSVLPGNKKIKEGLPVLDLGWSYGAQFLAVCSTRTNPSVPSVTVWQNHTQEESAQFPSDVGTIAWPRNDMEAETLAVGRRLAPAALQVWKDITGSHPTSNTYFYPEERTWGITRIAWSPDGNYLAAAIASIGLVYVWDINTPDKPYYTYTGHIQNIANTQVQTDIRALAWSPSGTMIASGGTDNVIRVWASGISTP